MVTRWELYLENWESALKMFLGSQNEIRESAPWRMMTVRMGRELISPRD